MSMDASKSKTTQILQQLANLQYIDSRIDEITQLRGDLPEEILDIETDILRKKNRLRALETELEDLKAEEAKLRNDIVSSDEKVQRYSDQQLTVRNNREYDALSKEIEAQKQVKRDSEFRLNEIETRSLEAAQELEDLQSDLQKTQETHDLKQANLEKVVEETRQEEKVLLEKRKAVEADVEPRYLKAYNRLRNGLANKIAVVAMRRDEKKGVGSALGMKLPPQAMVDVLSRDQIVIDETSGRYVVDPSFFEEAAKKLQI